MEAERDRVRNLFMDTMTLLCKNNLHYSNHLTVEGLVGIKLDTSDVLFVHISEKFIKEGANNSESGEDPNDGSLNLTGVTHQSIRDPVSIACETIHQTNKSDAICEGDSNNSQEQNKVEASILGGQRKVPRKPSSPHRSLSAYSSNVSECESPHIPQREVQVHAEFQNRGTESEHFNMLDNSVKQDQFTVGLAQQTVSPPKRLKENIARNKTSVPVTTGTLQPQDSQTPWPNVAGNLVQPSEPGQYLAQLDMNTVANTTNTNNNTALVQPGCSTWTTQAQPAQVHTDPVVSSAPSLLSETSQNLTFPPCISSPSQQKTNTSARRKLRASTGLMSSQETSKHWNGKTFACEFCSYQSKRLWNLQRHLRKHTTPPLRCVLCRDETYFGCEADLQEHTEFVHRNVTRLEQQLKAYSSQDCKDTSPDASQEKKDIYSDVSP